MTSRPVRVVESQPDDDLAAGYGLLHSHWRDPVATSEQLKALLKSHVAGDDERFRATALQIAAHSARKGNTQLANDLRNLLDEARRKPAPTGVPRAVPIARPVGELAGLLTASYPTTQLGDMVLAKPVRDALVEVVRQYRQRDRLRHHGLTPKRKLLLIGPPGCGKTMTASALAGECNLPLMFVQLHSLITKYMGETAVKLHLVFDAMVNTRGVYLFDEFDAIGSTRAARNDVGEMRRILNSFLQFLERDDSESLVVAATNFVGMLDDALFRRFDDVIAYSLPDRGMIQALIENRLSSFQIDKLAWQHVTRAARGLSHAEVTRACDDAAKAAVLSDSHEITTELLGRVLQFRRSMRPPTARPRVAKPKAR
jgi:SpoVK/Ycf46/Vps4 family AAA+-type ATPase